MNVQQAMEDFLRIYNRDRDAAVALTSGLKASAQRNRLYRSGSGRQPIRLAWKDALTDLGQRYKRPRSLRDHFSDVAELRARMNASFGTSFVKDGFKASHAQKSLTVYLKHLWCIGMIPSPPTCPIDRRILRAIVKGRTPSWTAVVTVKEHKEMMGWVMEMAGGDRKVAVWELLTFSA